MKISYIILFLFVSCFLLSAQDTEPQAELRSENIKAKGSVVNESTFRLRWAPANTKAWLDGQKYGYLLERYTLIVDSVLLDKPISIPPREIKLSPAAAWEEQVEKSDYAAVVAQAFYGEDFELTSTSSGVGDIINQANELQQRFATSLFMAEYDYSAAELAGWGYTDRSVKKNEKYLYRIILNKPEKQQGDTALIFIGYDNKRALPEPVYFNAVWGDRSVMLSWNYELLSDTYHSYQIERKGPSDTNFKQINNLPVTALDNSMQMLFYTDSLPDNETQYSYRIKGITSFEEEGPVSDTISGQGKKKISCVPNITRGTFINGDDALIFWSFDCEDPDQIDQFVIKRASSPNGVYETLVSQIPIEERNMTFKLKEDRSYIRLLAVTKDSIEKASYPFLLSKEDTIPPAVPTGLKVEIDSTAVAYLTWDSNTEPDLYGYRVLRSFNSDEEKSSISEEIILQNEFTDTLSLELGNEKVYYSITALDSHFNESQPCQHVAAIKPNTKTPPLPAIVGYEVSADGKVSISWKTDERRKDIRYLLMRIDLGTSDSDTVIWESDAKVREYIDEPEKSGEYIYWVVARDLNGKQSESPQRLNITVTVSKEIKGVERFGHYVNRDENYIELSWRKHPQAAYFRIYKQIDDKPAFLWKELDKTETQVLDENISLGTLYRYTIISLNNEGRMSPAKTIKIEY